MPYPLLTVSLWGVNGWPPASAHSHRPFLMQLPGRASYSLHQIIPLPCLEPPEFSFLPGLKAKALQGPPCPALTIHVPFVPHTLPLLASATLASLLFTKLALGPLLFPLPRTFFPRCWGRCLLIKRPSFVTWIRPARPQPPHLSPNSLLFFSIKHATV